jgi:hypothetical protein
MKGPKRICPGEYVWDVFKITKNQNYDYDGRLINCWNVGVREGYWFGTQGYFEAGYGIDSFYTYADAKEFIAEIMEDKMFKVKYKGRQNYRGYWDCDKDENGNYIVDEEAA